MRFDPSASHPRRARATQLAEVIDISSDEDDNDDEVIIIPSDDDDDGTDTKVVSQNIKGSKAATPVSRVSTHKARTTPKKCSAPASMRQRPVTVARILAGDFGDPKTWTFGLPEPNFMDVEKMVEDTRPCLKDFSGAELVAKIARLRATDPKVYGVSYSTSVPSHPS